MPCCVSKNKQDQDLLQTSNGVGVIVSRQMLYLMHDKNFTKASQAATFLGLIPIKSLNPLQSGIFTQCVIGICAVRYTGIEMLVLDMKLITIKPKVQDMIIELYN